MDNKRLIHPTPNNPVSSRSHMVICLTCIPGTAGKEAKNIIFLDLAGNENEFQCNKPAVIVKFYEKYMKETNQNKLKNVFSGINLNPTCSNDKIDTINTSASTMDDYIGELNYAIDTLTKLQEKITSIEKIKKFLEHTEIKELTQKEPPKDERGDDAPLSLMTYLCCRPHMAYIPQGIFRSDYTIKQAEVKKKDDEEIKKQKDEAIKKQKERYNEAIEYIKQLDLLWEDYETVNKTDIELYTIKDKKSIIYRKPTTSINKILTGANYDNFGNVGLNTGLNYLKISINNTKIDIFIVLMKQIQFELDTLLTTNSSLTSDEFDKIKKKILALTPDDKFDILKTGIIQNIERRKKEITCDIPKLKAIAEECKKRRYEGFMINKSIRDMIKEIKSLMRVKLIREDKKEDKTISYMPLCFETQIYENCLDPLKDQEIYDKFYDKPKTDTNSSKILQTIREQGVDLQNLDFIIFTIINISDTTNNPPDPPFININDLIKHTHIIKDDKEMENAYIKVLDKLRNYKFYYPEPTSTDPYYIDQITDITKKPSTKLKADALIEFINNVNQTTLIGTLESSDKLKHYIFNDMPCLITENTDAPSALVGGKHQFIEDSNHMTDQNRHVSTRKKQSTGSKRTRKSNKDYRYS
jgi:hypothetical protein